MRSPPRPVDRRRALRRTARGAVAALLAPVVTLATVGLLTGCDAGEVTAYDAPKTPVAGAPAAAGGAAPAGTPAPDAAAANPAALPAAQVSTASTPPNPAPAGPVTAAAEPVGPAVPVAVAPPAALAADAAERVVTVGGVKFAAPADWKEDPKPRMMRLTTLLVEGNGGKAEVILTQLNGPAGEMLANVNRWRGQVGLPPLAAFDEAAVPKVKLAGKEAMLFDMAGPEAAPTKRQIQVVAPRGDAGTYYIKIIGDAALVGAQKAKFDKMLTTVELPG